MFAQRGKIFDFFSFFYPFFIISGGDAYTYPIRAWYNNRNKCGVLAYETNDGLDGRARIVIYYYNISYILRFNAILYYNNVFSRLEFVTRYIQRLLDIINYCKLQHTALHGIGSSPFWPYKGRSLDIFESYARNGDFPV